MSKIRELCEFKDMLYSRLYLTAALTMKGRVQKDILYCGELWIESST